LTLSASSSASRTAFNASLAALMRPASVSAAVVSGAIEQDCFHFVQALSGALLRECQETAQVRTCRFVRRADVRFLDFLTFAALALAAVRCWRARLSSRLRRAFARFAVVNCDRAV
jgi:hypothetical protein